MNCSPAKIILTFCGPKSISGGMGMKTLNSPFSSTDKSVTNCSFMKTCKLLLGIILPTLSVN